VTFGFRRGRIGWVQVVSGTVTLNAEQLRPGDGVALEAGGTIILSATSDAEVLLFDMIP